MLLDSFSVPEFSLPFANSKHPQAEQANAEATEWAVGHRLINEDAPDGFAGIGFGHLAARVSHEASYERLVTFAQWMAWSFVLDDQHDHLIRTGRLEAWHPFAQAITGHLAGERAPQLPRNRLASAFVELCDRILADMPTGPRERYRSHVPEMLSALDQEAANRTAAGLPRLIDYILTRRHSSQLPATRPARQGPLA